MGKRKWKQMDVVEEKRETTLFDLPAKDIMMTHVSQYLRMGDLINLRLCSRKCKDLADVMFAGIRTFQTYREGTIAALFLKKTRRLRLLIITALGGTKYTNETVHYVLSNNYLLNEVTISNCPNITSWGIMPLAEYCKNISHLALDSVPISDEFLQALGRHKLLKVSFKIDKKHKNKDCPSQAALQAFFEKQLIIEIVYLDHIIDLSPIVSTIANFCANLKKLDIPKCVLFNDKVLIELANKCPKLEYLDIARVSPRVSNGVHKVLRWHKRYEGDMLYESDSNSEYSTVDVYMYFDDLDTDSHGSDEGESSEDVEDYDSL